MAPQAPTPPKPDNPILATRNPAEAGFLLVATAGDDTSGRLRRHSLGRAELLQATAPLSGSWGYFSPNTSGIVILT